MTPPIDERTEWLEADGLGGFASGTAGGVRTRRYHALLLAAANPPTSRFVLVAGVDAVVRTPAGEFHISPQRYRPGVLAFSTRARIEAFTPEPWPRWVVALDDGTRVAHEVFVTRGMPRAVVTWRLLSSAGGARLRVRPLIAGRDYHALHRENPALRFDPAMERDAVRFSPYMGVPGFAIRHNGGYVHEPAWYRGFEYEEERRRGFEHAEDLASPGVFEFDLAHAEAHMVLVADAPALPGHDPAAPVERLRSEERERRAAHRSRLERSADAYLVARGEGSSIIAGYPWFADWGRDTFIALRGLCLATGRLEEARGILLAWAGTDSMGVLPNRFPDRGDEPEYNSVDASLWFVVAADELMRDADAAGRPLAHAEAERLRGAVGRIVQGYARGTHHGIRMDEDGLLAAGEPGVQLTWMDARIGDRVVTPRIGKPVEVQALWLNALLVAARWDARWADVFDRGLRSFRSRFWNEARGCLYDVVDAEHVPGKVDGLLRPNQVFAVGGLPRSLLGMDRARRVVDAVEGALLTPIGLRTLAPGEPGYQARYAGGPVERDEAYHQGTAWPWLMGPFVEAWVRVRGSSPAAKAEARERFLAPLLRHLDEAGLGHISEVADAEHPFTPGGCPFQAWSLGEALRLDRRVLAEDPVPVRARA